MKGFKKGEIWLRYKTGDVVMFVHHIDKQVYYHDFKENCIKFTTADNFLDLYIPKSIVANAKKPKLLALDAAAGELMTTLILIMCISLLIMANMVLFRYLMGY